MMKNVTFGHEAMETKTSTESRYLYIMSDGVNNILIKTKLFWDQLYEFKLLIKIKVELDAGAEDLITVLHLSPFWN